MDNLHLNHNLIEIEWNNTYDNKSCSIKNNGNTKYLCEKCKKIIYFFDSDHISNINDKDKTWPKDIYWKYTIFPTWEALTLTCEEEMIKNLIE